MAAFAGLATGDNPFASPVLGEAPGPSPAEEAADRAAAEVLRVVSEPKPVRVVELTEAQAAEAPAAPGAAAPSAKAASDDEPPEDPRAAGERALEWLLYPMSPSEFFADVWEKRPLVIRRNAARPGYHDGIISVADIRGLLARGALTYEDDLDITAYADGKRTTHNGSGVVAAADAWGGFEAHGRSLRLLCPHAHLPAVYGLLARLEDGFGAFTGSNSYLTPPGTQGFAPHYDDIEAFLLQTAGAKRWRVHRPLGASAVLPRHSSPNFSQAEVGEPALVTELRQGDLLYLPRGWIHQAEALPGEPSLHLTVSTAMRFTWQDLVASAAAAAVRDAAAEDPAFRRTLPRDMMDVMGVSRADDDEDEDEDEDEEDGSAAGEDGSGASARRKARTAYAQRAAVLLERAMEAVNVDAAADQMTRRFLRQRLPPAVDGATERLQARHVDPSVLEGVEAAPGTARAASSATAAPASSSSSSSAAPGGEFSLTAASVVRLAHPRGFSMAVEGGECAVYHAHTNSVRFEGAPEGRLVYDLAVAPAVEALIRSYPAWISAEDLPVMDDEADEGRVTVFSAIEELVLDGAVVHRTLA